MYFAESAAADSEFEMNRRQTQAPPQLLAVTSAFDVQLGERFLK